MLLTVLRNAETGEVGGAAQVSEGDCTGNTSLQKGEELRLKVARILAEALKVAPVIQPIHSSPLSEFEIKCKQNLV